MFAHLRLPGPDGVGVAFSDRSGGVSSGRFESLNLGRTDVDDPSDVMENFRLVRERLGLGALFTVSQVHGTNVVEITPDDLAAWRPGSELGDSIPGQARLPVADALVTRHPGVALAIRVADCLPVLFADPDAGVIGAAHAGRRGLLDGVLDETVHRMLGLGASRLTAWIGPHVCGSCYELPDEMVEELEARWPGARTRTPQGTQGADLGAVAATQLLAQGCEVIRWDPCTLTTPSLFSHRRDGDAAGRQIGVVWRHVG